MKLLRNSLPVVCFALLLLFLAGWTWMDWSVTRLLPWAAVLLVLFVCSLSWAMSASPGFRRVHAAWMILIAIIPGALLVTGLAEFRAIWGILTLAGLGSILLYLYETARSSSVYSGALQYLLIFPPLLVVYALIAVFGWNGTLFPAWMGLLLMVLLAVIGLFGTRKPE
jgi:hypothetical protein